MSARPIEQLAALGIAARRDGPTEQRVPCPRCGRGECELREAVP